MGPRGQDQRLRVLTHLPVDEFMPDSISQRAVDFVRVPMEGAVDPDLRGEVLLTLAWGSPNLSQLLERGVEWIHTLGTGVDRFPLDMVGKRILTCSRGASAIPIAEWVLAMILTAEKRLPGTWIESPPPNWRTPEGGTLGRLTGRTLGLIGLGGIGRAVALRAMPFGMRVRAVRRSSEAPEIPGVETAESLEDLVASADHLVIAAPSTPATRHMVDESLLASAGPGLHLINVARGALVDLEALREALDSGAVGLASLDCVEPEPLPVGHWLYEHPRVRLSPHVSWSTEGAVDALYETFFENLERYLDGRPLVGRVDVDQAY